MTSNGSEIDHISDTALMTAACRALETGRDDGLVHDPFAEALAGERGMAILQGLEQPEIMCFGVGIRSRFMDELVMDALEVRKAKTVLSLGAGLDTRPWRLAIPAGVRWVEVDFPAILEYKDRVMGVHKPHCELERMVADLNDRGERESVFGAAGGGPALMITEGLLMYLPAATVEGLAAEAGQSGIGYWLLDVASGDFSKRVRMGNYASIDRLRAADHLEGEDILAAATRNGWGEVRRRTYIVDAMQVALERIKATAAKAAAAGARPTEPPNPNDPSGVWLLGRG